MRRAKQLITTALILGLSLFGLSAQADESLGIGVQVVESSQGDLSMGNRAWFGIEPGQQGSVVFRVSSQSDLDQTVTYEVFDKTITNGVSQPDTSKLSETAQWLSFEPAVAVVPARGTREIEMTYDIPEDAPEEAFDAVLRVLATGETETEDSVAGSKAVLGSAVGVDIDVWLGVGSAVSLLPNFDIRDVQGVILPQGRFLRVEFENLGTIPLSLRGSVQFADPVLVERSFEPTNFVGRIIPSGETGYVDVPVIEEITDGNWNVFVSANQSQVRQTRLFEKEIIFAAPTEGEIPWGAIQLALIALFSLLTVFGLRKMFRSSPTSETKPRRSSRLVSALKDVRLPRLRLPSINLRLPSLPRFPERKPRAPKPEGQTVPTGYSENRAWANSKQSPEPINIPPRVHTPKPQAIDEDQLEQAIQRTLLKVLENTAQSAEQDKETKPEAKPKNKK